ncbi:MAG: S1/P1 nuclease [Candidatus Velthaea sp.]
MRRIAVVVAAALAVCAADAPAFAWGSAGHRLIGQVAAEHLPASVPAFVRTAEAIAEIAALGPEADRLKGSGKMWDADEDQGHFVDLGDDGRVGGVVDLTQLPASREDYDTALRAAKTDQYKMGYLPYQIIDGYLQVVTDFAYWRADIVGERSGATPADKAFFAADRRLREVLTLRDIGYWSHFVGDASQPLHVSVHYNGWGDFANPRNFSNSRTIHARFESALVHDAATGAGIAAHLRPYAASSEPIAARVAAYLQASRAGVPRVYELEAAGAIDARAPQAVDFALERLAAGAGMLRDLIADAYTASAGKSIAYPAVNVQDIESGKIILTRTMFGSD